MGFGGATFIASMLVAIVKLKGHQSFRARGNQVIVSLAILVGIPGVVAGVMIGLGNPPERLWSILLGIGVLSMAALFVARMFQIAIRPMRTWWPRKEKPENTTSKPAPLVPPGPAPPTNPEPGSRKE